MYSLSSNEGFLMRLLQKKEKKKKDVNFDI